MSINNKKDKKLSKNLRLSEFGYYMPDVRLVIILQYLRNVTGCPVYINKKDGVGRTIEHHIEIYKNLEARKIIKTKKNGLGNKDLYDLIPFQSRHLPSFNILNLRAVDFSIKSQNNYLSGKDIFNYIQDFINSKLWHRYLKKAKFKDENDQYIGVGIGKTFVHLDIDRQRHTVWEYQ